MATRSVPSSRIRVTDAQRRETVERLRLALMEGGVTVSEFDARVTAAWAATTRDDLSCLTEDLPPYRPEPTSTQLYRRTSQIRPVVKAATAAWLVLSIMSVMVWGLLGTAHAIQADLWWTWGVGPTGALLAALWCINERKRGSGN